LSLSRETTPWLLVSTPALNRFGELDTSTCWERWKKNAESTAFTGAQRRDKKCFYVFDDRFTCTIFSSEHSTILGISAPTAWSLKRGLRAVPSLRHAQYLRSMKRQLGTLGTWTAIQREKRKRTRLKM
jgi:hypothetical protein